MGAGTVSKSVYESYRLPLSLFQQAEPALDTSRMATLDLVLDVTASGALAIDDIAFTAQGDCE